MRRARTTTLPAATLAAIGAVASGSWPGHAIGRGGAMAAPAHAALEALEAPVHAGTGESRVGTSATGPDERPGSRCPPGRYAAELVHGDLATARFLLTECGRPS